MERKIRNGRNDVPRIFINSLNMEQMLVFLQQQIGYQVTFLTACWPFLTSSLKLAKNLTFTLTKEYRFLMTKEQRTISASSRHFQTRSSILSM